MRAIVRAGEQGYKTLLVIADWASYAILCNMAVVIAIDVVCRFFFGFSIQIAEEVASLSLIAMVFLSLGGAFEDDSLLRVDAFYSPLPEGVKRILDPAFHLMGIAVTGFYIFYLSRLAFNSFSRDIHAEFRSREPQLSSAIRHGLGIVPVGTGACRRAPPIADAERRGNN